MGNGQAKVNRVKSGEKAAVFKKITVGQKKNPFHPLVQKKYTQKSLHSDLETDKTIVKFFNDQIIPLEKNVRFYEQEVKKRS